MSWGMVAMTAGTALIGGMQANEQQQDQKKQNLAAAEQTRYSNWTGRAGQQRFNAPSVFGGALQGGLSGFSMGQSMGMGGGGASAAKPTSQNMHGGSGFSAQAAPGASPYGSLVKQPQKTFY